MKKQTTTKYIALSAMFAALTCVTTMIIKIPTPLKGYVNPGDSMVLNAGWRLPLAYGFLAAAIGSGLADIFLGYATYAFATFFIKGIMAIIAYSSFHVLNKRFNKTLSYLIGGAIAEIFMVLGYFVFEGFLYSFESALINIPANSFQAVVGLILGYILVKALEKINFKI